MELGMGGNLGEIHFNTYLSKTWDFGLLLIGVTDRFKRFYYFFVLKSKVSK